MEAPQSPHVKLEESPLYEAEAPTTSTANVNSFDDILQDNTPLPVAPPPKIRRPTFAAEYAPEDVLKHLADVPVTKFNEEIKTLRLGQVDFPHMISQLCGTEAPDMSAVAAHIICLHLKIHQLENENKNTQKELRMLKRKISSNGAPDRFYPRAFVITTLTAPPEGSFVTPETSHFRPDIDFSKVFSHFINCSAFKGREGLAVPKGVRAWALFFEVIFYTMSKQRKLFPCLTSRTGNRTNELINVRDRKGKNFLCHDLLIDFCVELASLTNDEDLSEWLDGLRDFIAATLYESRRALAPDVKARENGETHFDDPAEKYDTFLHPDYK